MNEPSPAVDVIREAFRRGHDLWLRARGHSMRPAIQDGDRLLVTLCLPGALRRGDVVAYEVDGRLRVHRLIGRRRDRGRGSGSRLLLAGDNDPQAPDEVEARAVLGRVIARQHGRAMERLDTAWAWMRGVIAVLRRKARR